jgi:hypothetical protein
MSSHLGNNHHNYQTTNSTSSPFPSSQQQQNMLLQQQQNNNYIINNRQAYINNPPRPPLKQDMYRHYLELQQRQRQQQQPYIMHQQHLISQSMNNYMNTNGNYPSSSSSSTTTVPTTSAVVVNNYHQPAMYNNTAEEQQYNNYANVTTTTTTTGPAIGAPRRASAPATTSSSSSYNIANSNSCALNKAHLKLNGDLMDMIVNWSMPEWQSGRRLVQFWRHTNNGADGNLSLVECGFDPMDQQVYHQQRMRDVAAAAAAAVAVSNNNTPGNVNNSPPASTNRPAPIVISCIYWRERNDYFITSVDCIYLLESLIGIQFTVEEKNRIRRTLEGFRPLTVSKCKVECADFFKLIMSFPHPKPRNIEKDVKVFAWKTLPHALRKIIRKYTPSYITSTPLEPIQQHQHNRYVTTNGGNNEYAQTSSSSNIF